MKKTKITVCDLAAKKQSGEKIVCLTAYDWTMARLVDAAGVDLVLVGDSVANVCYGQPTTLGVDMEQMINHTRAVAAGVSRALLVADMPFMSYQISAAEAVANAGRLVRAGAEAVKLEGAGPVADVIRRIVEVGIPVLGHVGLLPQSIHRLGGYHLQGRTQSERDRLLADALELQRAGCFAVVIEKVIAECANAITAALEIPTIGIGAGPGCDGQILVVNDVIGLSDAPPFRFVRQYARLWEAASAAIAEFCGDVRAGRFPGQEHTFHADEDV